MKISYFCTTWGQKNSDWDTFFRKVVDAGYDGVETSLPPEHEKDKFIEGLSRYNLGFIGQHWETRTGDFESHRSEYSARLRALALLRPAFINSHTGKDHFSFKQNSSLISDAADIAGETGIPVFHETHRGRFAFAAHVTEPFLKQYESLELTLDVSHWCNVAESLLQDQEEALDIALRRTRHIHARIGFEQGPQVFDFTLPQYSAALQFHLQCWDRIVSHQIERREARSSITPEFGPPPYMQLASPGDGSSVQWKMNVDLMDVLRQRYQNH